MIREKLGISFARLIPEVSAGERERDGENKEGARPEKQQKRKWRRERKPITELASVGLCLSKNCGSFLRALASLSGEPEMQENGSEEGVGEMWNINDGKQTVTYMKSNMVEGISKSKCTSKTCHISLMCIYICGKAKELKIKHQWGNCWPRIQRSHENNRRSASCWLFWKTFSTIPALAATSPVSEIWGYSPSASHQKQWAAGGHPQVQGRKVCVYQSYFPTAWAAAAGNRRNLFDPCPQFWTTLKSTARYAARFRTE